MLKQPRLGQITIDRSTDLIFRPEQNYFKSPGPVRIILEDADTHEKTTLLADDAEGQPNGDILVHGNIRVERPEGNLTGERLTYHGDTQTGEVYNARSDAMGMLLRGAKIDLMRDAKGRQVLRATQAYFTSCSRPRPDYHITAKEIRVTTDRRVTAKNVTFWLGSVRIISLPSLTRDFSKSSESPIPLPGYSSADFIHIRFHNDLLDRPSTALNYDLTISMRRTPSGTAIYEHDINRTPEGASSPSTRRFEATEPLRTALETTPALIQRTAPEPTDKRETFYAIVTGNSAVWNRIRTDLRVSRLPEIGLAFRNILNRPAQADTGDTNFPVLESAFGRGFLNPARWFVNAEVGAGYYQENPTHSTSSRLGFRADATTPLFTIEGPLYVRYGGTMWTNYYGRSSYTLLAPEAELDLLLKRNTWIRTAYRYEQDFGTTPFLWDHRDVRHELRFGYGFLGAHWAYDAEIKYDMERLRAYDSYLSIRRRLDCMEYGVGYHTRNQGFTLIFNLLPGGSTAPKPAAKRP